MQVWFLRSSASPTPWWGITTAFIFVAIIGHHTAITTTTASFSHFIGMVFPSFSTASYTAPRLSFPDISANAHIKSSSLSCCLQ
ncbi:hypothetical protein ACFX1X_041164 [Malus domestica]